MADNGCVAIGEAQRRIEQTPTDPIDSPKASGNFELDRAIIEALAIRGTKVVAALRYAQSLGSETAKIITEQPDRQISNFFLKIVSGETGSKKCEAEYESLKAIHIISPGFVPAPLAWGRCENIAPQSFFLIEQFRDIGTQPADPRSLAKGLADLHIRSKSPTGKFGFHIKTWHGEIEQDVVQWDDSWAALFGRHLGHVLEIAKPMMRSREFDVVCKLTLDKVVPRLLLPLQEEGRVIKASLLHGDCWDGNTALDANTCNAFIFDVCSFYGHNEYDIGNWRAPRHRLSARAYIQAYQDIVPISEPIEEWSPRNLLYSLTFNAGNFINIPGSKEAEVIYDDMTTLCHMFCPTDLGTAMAKLS